MPAGRFPHPQTRGGVFFDLSADPLSNVSVTGFASNGLRYQGTSAGATQIFTDGTLTLTGGAARTGSVAFAGTVFQPRVFAGELYYDVTPIPEPGTYGLMALGLLGLGLWQLQQQRRASQQG